MFSANRHVQCAGRNAGRHWSEPPIGVIGLEVGTFASYARPLQRMDFFEHNPAVVELSQPSDKAKQPYFRFVQDARSRGSDMHIFQGAPRPTLAKHAGRGFYQVLVIEPYKQGVAVLHEDLLTKEGLAACMEKVAPGGILCVHISNRHYKLAPIVIDAAVSLKWAWKRGQDQAPQDQASVEGHFSSEWIILAREEKSLQALRTPPGYYEALRENLEKRLGRPVPDEYWERYRESSEFWSQPKSTGEHLWTDKGPHSFKGLYFSDPDVARIRYWLNDFEDAVNRDAKLPQSSVAMFSSF